jgi:hypothetical protein
MTMASERRRRPRHHAGHWVGRYRLAGAAAWRDCTLVDVSAQGAGFEAYMLATDVALPRRVELQLLDRAAGDAEPIHLEGSVRHLARSPQGHVRVGIEFDGLTDLEGQLLALLFANDARRPVVHR